MGKQAMKQHGAFSWNELMTNDLAGASAFYSELLGWEVHEEDAAGVPYLILKAGGQEVGGMMAMPSGEQGMPTAWGSYVTVDDVDKQLGRAEALGGKVLIAARDIPGVGRFGVISDPQGAMITLITYSC